MPPILNPGLPGFFIVKRRVGLWPQSQSGTAQALLWPVRWVRAYVQRSHMRHVERLTSLGTLEESFGMGDWASPPPTKLATKNLRCGVVYALTASVFSLLGRQVKQAKLGKCGVGAAAFFT